MQNSFIWNATIFRPKRILHAWLLIDTFSSVFTKLLMPSFKAPRAPTTYLGILAFSCARVRAKFHYHLSLSCLKSSSQDDQEDVE